MGEDDRVAFLFQAEDVFLEVEGGGAYERFTLGPNGPGRKSEGGLSAGWADHGNAALMGGALVDDELGDVDVAGERGLAGQFEAPVASDIGFDRAIDDDLLRLNSAGTDDRSFVLHNETAAANVSEDAARFPNDEITGALHDAIEVTIDGEMVTGHGGVG